MITGGTKGVGEAIVRRLAAAGATVATTGRSPLPEGQAVELFVQAESRPFSERYRSLKPRWRTQPQRPP
ncbi:MAG: hypothetical protein MOB07_03515 [Acidobacteria bacterium]|nr:hypothetical protein [Acidobacteriota bacterium]